MKKLILILFMSVFLINFISATVTCNPNYIYVSYNNGESVSDSTSCTNSGNQSVTISKVGNYFTIDQTIIGPAPSSKSINIDFDTDAPPGEYQGSIQFSDGSSSIPIIQKINNPTPTSLISFPTSKRITVPQGEIYDRKVTMIMPSNYPNPINIQSIEFSEENNIIYFGDVETGILNPGEVKDIPIKINAKDAQPGEYPPISVLVRLDDNGEIVTLSSTLHIFVTASLNPETNTTFSSPPSCSLSASVMNLNNSYSFSCSNVQKNLEISPVFSEYFEGQNVQLSGSIYTYEFKPIKFGNTEFISTFTYLGAPLFKPFRNEVRISSSSSVIPGTSLKFLFTPKLNEISNGEEAIIQLIDNKSGSLIENPTIYVDAVQLSPLNNSPKSFPFKFDVGKNYEIRGEASGYDNLVETINVTSKEIEIKITPIKEIYNYGDRINITTDPQNASILVNGNQITNPESYSISFSGNVTIKAVMEDYVTSNKSIQVNSQITLIRSSCSREPENWRKGNNIICELSKNVSWEVYLDDELIETGDGKKIEFKINDWGNIKVMSGSLSIDSILVEKKGAWYKPWTYGWVKNIEWYWWVGIVVLLIGGGYWFFYRGGEKEGGLMFSPQQGEEA